jgi:uncharacterized repeat protein (TIGR01451 family)
MRRTLLALATATALAVPGMAAPAQAVTPPTAGCGPSGPITVVQGSTFGVTIGYTSGGNDVNFTATMRANGFFGPEHTFDTQHFSAGENLGVNKNVELTTAGFPAATHRVLIEISSDKTGSTVLGTCDIMLIVGSGDADGDGLYDNWETGGLDVDDGGVDLTLPGANPQRHDLYVEVDCLDAADHSHCPPQNALTDVVQAFANAPVSNPDGTTGIQLHLDTGPLFGAGVVNNVNGTNGAIGTIGDLGGGGTKIPEAGNEVLDWDGATGRAGTSVYALKNANFDRAKRSLVYRYSIFGHQTNARKATGDCTSGWADGIPGVNFIVTMGGGCWTQTRAELAGTFMHELGHTLGLGHGGGDGVNNKPNYLSVMNYSFQMCTVTSKPANGLPGLCDYSRDDLPDLDEINPPGLDECKGLSDPYGLGPVDWNGAGGLTGTTCSPSSANVQADVNGDASCVGPGADGNLNSTKSGDDVVSGSNINTGPDFICNSTANASSDDTQDLGVGSRQPVLAGYDDWDNIVYDFRNTATFASGVASPVPDEADPQTIQDSQQQLEEVLDADLGVTKTGPAEATPGDTLDYTITVHNAGPGPALGSKVTDTKPDGSVQVIDLGQVDAGQTVTRHTTYTVPVPSTDGATITNTAVVSGQNMVGNEQADATNDVSSATTTITAPVLTLAKTASATAAPGDAITYTLTYENTGGGAGESVAIGDTLPAGVYYSTALDTGSGPPPTTVVANADGTTTLVWTIGHVAAHSGPQTIQYTARTGLLAAGGDTVTNAATLGFDDANANHYPGLNAQATTTLTAIAPTRNPLGLGSWRNTPSAWTAEIRARIQATDQRYDLNHDGVLSTGEVAAAFVPSSAADHTLAEQLLAVYFNLATHRIAAGTGNSSKTADRLGLTTVRKAAIYAQDTLAIPWTRPTRSRYGDATEVLKAINEGRSEVY